MSVIYEYTKDIEPDSLRTMFEAFASNRTKQNCEELMAELQDLSDTYGFFLHDRIVTKDEFDTKLNLLRIDKSKKPIIDELWVYHIYSKLHVKLSKAANIMNLEIIRLANEKIAADDTLRIEQANLLEIANTARAKAEHDLNSEIIHGNIPFTTAEAEVVPENETAEQRTLRLIAKSLSCLSTMSSQTSKPKVKPVKIMPQIHFYGNQNDKGNNIILWLQSIQANMDYCEVPLQGRVRCASAHLNDYALRVFSDWIKTASPNDLISWDAFTKEMKLRCLPLDHLDKVRESLTKIKQQTSVLKYNEEFEKLYAQLDTTEQAVQSIWVTLYLNGLQTAVRENIKYFLLTSLKENMVRALLFDSSHPSERQGNRIQTQLITIAKKTTLNILKRIKILKEIILITTIMLIIIMEIKIETRSQPALSMIK